jgi:HK97 family phage major capsid protein
MAAKIHELRAARTRLAQEANAALIAARDRAAKAEKAEDKSLTAEETAAQDAFDVKLKAADGEIAIEERLLDRERRFGSAAPARDPAATAVPGSGKQPRTTGSAPNFEEDPAKGFRSSREFVLGVMAHEDGPGDDERLKLLVQRDPEDKQAGGRPAYLVPVAFTPRSVLAAAGSDEQGEYDDRYGGFAVTTTRLPGLLSVGFEGDPTAGRTQPIPMASPSVEIMALVDKDHSSSVSGGFTVARRAETVAGSASRAQLEMVTLKASSLFGGAVATEEILADSPVSFAAIIATGFNTQFGAHILNEKLRGKGGTEMLGVLTALAASSLGPTISVAKESGQAAKTIEADNILKMAERAWGYGNAVWHANHNTRSQLAKLAIKIGTSIIPLYQPATQPGFPDMLWGRPVLYTEYCATLGTAGDVILANWSQYLEGVFQPLQSAESVHARFMNHERLFKFWLRNCGAPWWRSAMTPAQSTDTLSPFVILANRA